MNTNSSFLIALNDKKFLTHIAADYDDPVNDFYWERQLIINDIIIIIDFVYFAFNLV